MGDKCCCDRDDIIEIDRLVDPNRLQHVFYTDSSGPGFGHQVLDGTTLLWDCHWEKFKDGKAKGTVDVRQKSAGLVLTEGTYIVTWSWMDDEDGTQRYRVKPGGPNPGSYKPYVLTMSATDRQVHHDYQQMSSGMGGHDPDDYVGT